MGEIPASASDHPRTRGASEATLSSASGSTSGGSPRKLRGSSYRWIISGVALLLFLLHLWLQYRSETLTQLDAIGLGIAVTGLSPWIARILESAKVFGWEFNFLKEQVDLQGGDLETLKFLFAHFLSSSELKWLRRLDTMEEFKINTHHFPEEFKSEIRHLRGLGFITHKEGKGLVAMYSGPVGDRDVHEHFVITESGRKYLQFRKIMEQRV